jgi:hypothetical protein
MTNSSTEEAVRRWAKGIYAMEAGVELLIRHGKAIRPRAPWITEIRVPAGEAEMAALNVDELAYRSGAWSGGERRIVSIALSLLGGEPVDLADAVAGLGGREMEWVLAAISHANGAHESAGGTAYPWPRIRQESKTGQASLQQHGAVDAVNPPGSRPNRR